MSFAIAIVLAIGSVIIDAMVAGQRGSPRLGTHAATYQRLKFGAITCVVMLILGILAAGSEFRHRTIIPVLLATPHRARVFAVKVAGVGQLYLGTVVSSACFAMMGAALGALTRNTIGLTSAPGPDPGRVLSPAAAGLVLAGYAIALLLAATRTTMRRDVA